MDFKQELSEVRASRRSARFSGQSASLPDSRLDRSTLLDRMLSDQPAERRLTIRYYKKAGVVQVGWGSYKQEEPKTGLKKVTPEEAISNQQRATRRACAFLRRDLLSIQADHLLTLTYRENMQDRKLALTHLAKFIRVMRRRFSRWASISVMEFQKRGAIHFHIGVHGFYDVKILRSEWLEIVGADNGNIDAVHIKFQPDGRGNPCTKLAVYMGKYLAKDLDQGRKPGEHRYFRTQDIERPKETYYIPASAPSGEEERLALEVIKTLLGFRGLSRIWCAPPGVGSSGFMCAELGT